MKIHVKHKTVFEGVERDQLIDWIVDKLTFRNVVDILTTAIIKSDEDLMDLNLRGYSETQVSGEFCVVCADQYFKHGSFTIEVKQ